MSTDDVPPLSDVPQSGAPDLPREVLLREVQRSGPLPCRGTAGTRVYPWPSPDGRAKSPSYWQGRCAARMAWNRGLPAKAPFGARPLDYVEAFAIGAGSNLGLEGVQTLFTGK